MVMLIRINGLIWFTMKIKITKLVKNQYRSKTDGKA